MITTFPSRGNSSQSFRPVQISYPNFACCSATAQRLSSICNVFAFSCGSKALFASSSLFARFVFPASALEVGESGVPSEGTRSDSEVFSERDPLARAASMRPTHASKAGRVNSVKGASRRVRLPVPPSSRRPGSCLHSAIGLSRVPAHGLAESSGAFFLAYAAPAASAGFTGYGAISSWRRSSSARRTLGIRRRISALSARSSARSFTVVGWTLRPVAGRPLFGVKELFVGMNTSGL